MTKRKTRREAQELYDRLLAMSARGTSPGEEPTSPAPDGETAELSHAGTMMKQFRFQLLHRWLIEKYEPCRVADIGGGKGLLAYLLRRNGWAATVIDPVPQDLPTKFKDLSTGKRVRIAPTERVPRVSQEFAQGMARHYDLLVGMHAHGCNALILDAEAQFGCGFVLLPCCIVDEPFYPPLGIHWLESVLDYALWRGHAARPFRLHFRGQNIGFYAHGLNAERRNAETRWRRETRRANM